MTFCRGERVGEAGNSRGSESRWEAADHVVRLAELSLIHLAFHLPPLIWLYIQTYTLYLVPSLTLTFFRLRDVASRS